LEKSLVFSDFILPDFSGTRFPSPPSGKTFQFFPANKLRKFMYFTLTMSSKSTCMGNVYWMKHGLSELRRNGSHIPNSNIWGLRVFHFAYTQTV
jgi:hypothetical protein